MAKGKILINDTWNTTLIIKQRRLCKKDHGFIIDNKEGCFSAIGQKLYLMMNLNMLVNR